MFTFYKYLKKKKIEIFNALSFFNKTAHLCNSVVRNKIYLNLNDCEEVQGANCTLRTQ